MGDVIDFSKKHLEKKESGSIIEKSIKRASELKKQAKKKNNKEPVDLEEENDSNFYPFIYKNHDLILAKNEDGSYTVAEMFEINDDNKEEWEHVFDEIDDLENFELWGERAVDQKLYEELENNVIPIFFLLSEEIDDSGEQIRLYLDVFFEFNGKNYGCYAKEIEEGEQEDGLLYIFKIEGENVSVIEDELEFKRVQKYFFENFEEEY